jgi:hypothetical protein
LETIRILDVKDFTLGFRVCVSVLVNGFKGIVIKATEEKNFVIAVLDAAGIKLRVYQEF